MKLADAADQWIEAKKQIRALDAQLKAAETVLKEHFRTTGRTVYKAKIGYSTTSYQALDTDAVKAELADRLDKFQVTRTRETLSLLG